MVEKRTKARGEKMTKHSRDVKCKTGARYEGAVGRVQWAGCNGTRWDKRECDLEMGMCVLMKGHPYTPHPGVHLTQHAGHCTPFPSNVRSSLSHIPLFPRSLPLALHVTPLLV